MELPRQSLLVVFLVHQQVAQAFLVHLGVAPQQPQLVEDFLGHLPPVHPRQQLVVSLERPPPHLHQLQREACLGRPPPLLRVEVGSSVRRQLPEVGSLALHPQRLRLAGVVFSAPPLQLLLEDSLEVLPRLRQRLVVVCLVVAAHCLAHQHQQLRVACSEWELRLRAWELLR